MKNFHKKKFTVCDYNYKLLRVFLNFNDILVNLNFFIEKHGKNSRDSHFSCLSKFVKDESLIKKIESTQDVVDAIHHRQQLANQNKKGKPITNILLL